MMALLTKLQLHQNPELVPNHNKPQKTHNIVKVKNGVLKYAIGKILLHGHLVIKKALDGAKLLVLVYRKPQLYHEKVQISARNF